MYNTQKVPVTLLRSTDEGAPQLDYNDTTSVRKILKACLVDGFGGKPGLGWTQIGEHTFRAEAGIHYDFSLRIANESSSNLKVVVVGGATDNTDGTVIIDQQNQIFWLDYDYVDGNSVAQWSLIGNGRTFVFLINHTAYSSTFYRWLFCGDLSSNAQNERGILLNYVFSPSYSSGLSNSHFSVYTPSTNTTSNLNWNCVFYGATNIPSSNVSVTMPPILNNDAFTLVYTIPFCVVPHTGNIAGVTSGKVMDKYLAHYVGSVPALALILFRLGEWYY